MTAKLNQIIAVEKGIKSRVYGEITEINKIVQKAELFTGFAKEYRKKDEDGEDLPAEKKRVQFAATELLRQVERLSTELMDITARKDWTNCTAVADITVDGRVIISRAPVTFLLFLEKQLTDLRTLVGNCRFSTRARTGRATRTLASTRLRRRRRIAPRRSPGRSCSIRQPPSTRRRRSSSPKT